MIISSLFADVIQ